jgi:hypothetical protein
MTVDLWTPDEVLDDRDDVPTCRVCGCTDYTACQEYRGLGDPVPCHWVADDLCSACEGK